jgi:hypothetical protein
MDATTDLASGKIYLYGNGCVTTGFFLCYAQEAQEVTEGLAEKAAKIKGV